MKTKWTLNETELLMNDLTCEAMRKPPSDETVREASLRYIKADFFANWKKYSPEDFARIEKLILNR